MRIRGYELDINFKEELEGFDFIHERIRDNKLQCCSPFREERKPSFAINLESGLWIDSGATDDCMRKGNFVSFLAYMKGCSFEEIENYLIEKYSIDFKDTSKLVLKINLDPNDELKSYTRFSPSFEYSQYLNARGIDKATQQLFNTFEIVKDGKRVVGMPWTDKHGNIVNIKYRCIENKFFFYEEHGEPIKNYLFGLNLVLQYKPNVVWIVESEIDAMYLWSCGLYAVALGRASYNDKQLRELRKLDITTVVLATDNDTVGIKVKDLLSKDLLPYFKVKYFNFPNGKKDVNDIEKYYFKDDKNILSDYLLYCKI